MRNCHTPIAGGIGSGWAIGAMPFDIFNHVGTGGRDVRPGEASETLHHLPKFGEAEKIRKS